MVLAVPDEPARGRKPVLRDELTAVVAKQQYPSERLLSFLVEVLHNGLVKKHISYIALALYH
jgi:hypothetical protein